jgi:hypothetical protein
MGMATLVMWMVWLLMAAVTPEGTALLVVQEGGAGPELVLTWTIDCVRDPSDAPESIIAADGASRRLLYPATSELIAAWESDDQTGTDTAPAIAGTQVQAELLITCLVDNVPTTTLVMSTPVVVAPRLSAPLTASVADGSLVAINPLPVGVEVTLLDVVLFAVPKGNEVATVALQGAGADFSRTFSAADIDPESRSVRLSPTITTNRAGELVLSASFAGVDAIPIALRVGATVSEGEGEGEGEVDPPRPSCSATPIGAPGLLLLLLRRRARPYVQAAGATAPLARCKATKAA